MSSLFLATIISCNQVGSIISRLQKVAVLTTEQKKEITIELLKIVKTCPIIIKPYDSKTKTSN